MGYIYISLLHLSSEKSLHFTSIISNFAVGEVISCTQMMVRLQRYCCYVAEIAPICFGHLRYGVEDVQTY